MIADYVSYEMIAKSISITSNEIGKAKVSPKLSSDGVTFTVMIDATSEDDFTYLDISNLVEGDSSKYNLRFSTTDIYLSDNTTGTIVQDKILKSLSKSLIKILQRIVMKD